jgi:hypothetical protein
MGVMIIGVTTLSLLVWVIAASLAAECRAEKQRIARMDGPAGDSVGRAASDAPYRAA